MRRMVSTSTQDNKGIYNERQYDDLTDLGGEPCEDQPKLIEQQNRIIKELDPQGKVMLMYERSAVKAIGLIYHEKRQRIVNFKQCGMYKYYHTKGLPAVAVNFHLSQRRLEITAFDKDAQDIDIRFLNTDNIIEIVPIQYSRQERANMKGGRMPGRVVNDDLQSLKAEAMRAQKDKPCDPCPEDEIKQEEEAKPDWSLPRY